MRRSLRGLGADTATKFDCLGADTPLAPSTPSTSLQYVDSRYKAKYKGKIVVYVRKEQAVYVRKEQGYA